jgi:hypothetical protein
VLYLLHIDPPYRHARHYLGFTARATLAARLTEHALCGSKASPLLKAAMRAGCIVSIARIWQDGTRTHERRLKQQGGLSRHCPVCRAEGGYHR